MAYSLKEEKVSVADLTLGCFVSRLDRPWLDTPFKIQGFKIDSSEQITELQRYCNHVYIDVEQGLKPRFRTNRKAPVAVESERLRRELERLRKKLYTESHHFEDEVPRAKKAYEDLSANLGELMNELQMGNSIELEAVRQGVNAMLDSLIRNPNAFLWINRLKQSDQYTYRHLLGTSIWWFVRSPLRLGPPGIGRTGARRTDAGCGKGKTAEGFPGENRNADGP